MHRALVLAVCSLAFGGLHPGAPEAAAQVAPPGRPEAATRDTLTITLADAQRRTLSLNPAYLAERQELAIARGQLTQARVFTFNPELEFRARAVGTRGAIGEFEASLSQEMEWGGQRRLRVRAASFGVDRAESVVQNAARETLADVSTAFYSALAAEQRLDVARQLLALSEQLVGVTRIQAREGEISTLDANLAEIEAGRGRARVLAAEREATSARLELHRLTGIPPEQEIRLEPEGLGAAAVPNLDTDGLISLALSRRPDLAARSRAVAQYESLAGLSRREAIPNVRVGVFVERAERHVLTSRATGAPNLDTRLESPRLGLGVSVPIPVFQRNQGLFAERGAQAEQARLARQATELTVRTQVTDAVRAYRAANQEVRVFEQDVLQPARTNQRLLETAFRAGKVGLPTLLLLRNQLLDAELSYWDAWLAERRALVALQAATASFGIDSTLTPPGDR